jgi:uncharacterized protein HemX
MEHTHPTSHGVHTHVSMKYVAIVLVLLIAGITGWYLVSQKTTSVAVQEEIRETPKEIGLSAYEYDTLALDTLEEEIATIDQNINTVDTLENF